MPQNQTQRTAIVDRVYPVYETGAIMEHVNLGPSLTLAKGTVLGQIANSANDVQTISDTGTVGGGTFTISGTNPVTGETFTTVAINHNANNATVQAALETYFGAGNVVVAGSGLPGNDTTITFQGELASRPVQLMTINGANLNGTDPVLAIARTTTGRSKGTYVAYNDSGTDDGRRVAKAILPIAVTTDASGWISDGSLVGGLYGVPSRSIEVYKSGYFRVTDLVGLDANGVADLGKLISGDLTNGNGILCVTGA